MDCGLRQQLSIFASFGSFGHLSFHPSALGFAQQVAVSFCVSGNSRFSVWQLMFLVLFFKSLLASKSELLLQFSQIRHNDNFQFGALRLLAAVTSFQFANLQLSATPFAFRFNPSAFPQKTGGFPPAHNKRFCASVAGQAKFQHFSLYLLQSGQTVQLSAFVFIFN